MRSQFTPINFGRFRLTHRLASHAAAELFIAKLGKNSARRGLFVVKRLRSELAENTELIETFTRLGQRICGLNHRNILNIYELGKVEDQFYIAMEYVHGFNARQLRRVLAVRHQKLPLSLALSIVSKVLQGLGHAHHTTGSDGMTHGMVHRDLFPSNIIISLSGEVKVSDFGISQVYRCLGLKPGDLTAKFGYMAPEQLAGARVDHRADLFSAGILLAELSTGQRLFKGMNSYETLEQVRNVRLDSLREHLSELPSDVVEIIRRSIELTVKARYQSAGEFRAAVNEVSWRHQLDRSSAPLAAFLNHQVIPFLARAARTRLGGLTSPHVAPASATAPRAIQISTDLTPRPTAIFTQAALTHESTTVTAGADHDLCSQPTRIFATDLPSRPTAILPVADLSSSPTRIEPLNRLLFGELDADHDSGTRLTEEPTTVQLTGADLMELTPQPAPEAPSLEAAECLSTRLLNPVELRQLQRASQMPEPLCCTDPEPEPLCCTDPEPEPLCCTDPEREPTSVTVVGPTATMPVVQSDQGESDGGSTHLPTSIAPSRSEELQEQPPEGGQNSASGILVEHKEVSGQAPRQVTSILPISWFTELLEEGTEVAVRDRSV